MRFLMRWRDGGSMAVVLSVAVVDLSSRLRMRGRCCCGCCCGGQEAFARGGEGRWEYWLLWLLLLLLLGEEERRFLCRFRHELIRLPMADWVDMLMWWCGLVGGEMKSAADCRRAVVVVVVGCDESQLKADGSSIAELS